MAGKEEPIRKQKVDAYNIDQGYASFTKNLLEPRPRRLIHISRPQTSLKLPYLSLVRHEHSPEQ
jgi:hypothetical protein